MNHMPNPIDVLVSGGTKSEIVRVLGKKFPLSARQVFLATKNECGSSASYQGIHKALKQMEAAGILSREKTVYSLNPAWVLENKRFFDQAETRYAGRAKLSLLDVAENSSATVEFDSFLEAGLWFLDEMEKDYAANPTPDIGVICWRHPWALTTLPEKDFLRLRKLMDRDVHYALCTCDNPLDKALMDFWEKIGKKPKIGVDVAKNCDEIAVHDYYIQYFLPEKTRQQMDVLFKKAKAPDGKTLAEYYKILYEKKEKTKVVIVRNQRVADRLREEALAFYK